MTSLLPILCNQAATVLLGILGVKLISALVPPAVYANYAVFLTLTQISVMVTHSGIVNHAMRYWQRERGNAGIYARFLWAASWRGLIPLAVLLFVVVASECAIEKNSLWFQIFPWLLIGGMAMAILSIATGALNADGKLWAVFFATGLASAARILVPIGLVVLMGATFNVLSAGFAAHGIVLVGCFLVMFRRTPNASEQSPELAERWKIELKEYGRPFVILGIGAWLLQSADRWVVKLFFGDEQAGLFALAFNMGAIIPTFVVGGIMQRVFPEIFRQADHAKSSEEWRRIARRCDGATGIFLVVTLVGLWVLKALSPLLTGWLIGPKYIPALAMLFPAGLAMVTSQINQFYYLILQGQHNSAGIAKVMTIVASLKTLGSLVAASISWPVFLGWLVVSAPLFGILGRFLIRKMALTESELRAAIVPNSPSQ